MVSLSTHKFKQKEKMKNIRIMTAKIITFFAQLNFFSTMNKCKNFARLVICAFAISGLVACGGGSGDGGSIGGGTDPIDITIDDDDNRKTTAPLVKMILMLAVKTTLLHLLLAEKY